MAMEGGVEALHRLKSIDPPLWLTPSPDLSQTARKASQHLFSSLKPFCPKPMFDTLLVQGFDAEQIWQQIDLQTQPLVANLRRDVKRFEKNPGEISKVFGREIVKKSVEKGNDEDLDEESEGDDDDDDEGFDDEENGEFDEDEEDEEDGEEEEEEEGNDRGIEDRFLKINELEEYMEKDEAREYGGDDKKDKDEDDDDDEDDDEDGIGGFEDDSDGEGSAEKLGQARYEDFFGGKKKKVSKKESKPRDESEDEEQEDDDEQENDDGQKDQGLHNQTNGSLSTHEKQLKKLRSKIEQMEKENLEKKSWTMQGEVTASKRPKNSALEVDLDFEHNVRPMPVITEEVTASIEELIKKRILEEHFDDVQKASLPTKAPKQIKELDENKSKKGLGEIYEEEFVQQTGLGTGPVSSTDELKKEAQLLFDKLCLKLDALSHFHFKPKPVIEDMSIQTNVPALAMEEIAPVAVSDAAMLAPEEVFAGKGDIKEEAELTQADRKRRRANKKRKYKAEESKRVVKKVQDKTPTNNINGKETQV